MISIIVPAYNEASVIERTLGRLLDQETQHTYEIILIANGCTDGTADRARLLAPQAATRGVRLEIIDTPQGGKTRALNMGDAAAQYDLRIYCDADLAVSNNLVEQTVTALAQEKPLYLGYRLELAKSASFVTRAYGRMWRQLPLLDVMPHGIALCGVNAAGRARWGEFPNIVADDYFMRLQFRPDERVRVDSVEYHFLLPEGMHELLNVRSRWSRGHAEVARYFPEILKNEDPGNRYDGFARKMLSRPVDAAVFCSVYAYGKINGIANVKTGNKNWERAANARRAN